MKMILLILALVSSSALGASESKVGRYFFIDMSAKEYEIEPLEVSVKVPFPASIRTVGGAIDYLLQDAGYSLVERSLLDEPVIIMLENPLPRVHRNMGEMSLRNTLNTLSGYHFRVVSDPLRRKVNFVLKDKYRGLINE